MALSALLDLSVVFAAYCALIVAFDLPPFTTPGSFAGLTALYAAFWLAHRLLGRPTPGETLWKVAPPAELSGWRMIFPAMNRVRIAGARLSNAIFLTIASVLCAFWAGSYTVLNHPLWLSAEPWQLEAFLPASKQWAVEPFFYSLGAWPKDFQGHPVHYAVPYEKGPPTRFLGHVYARWDAPEIKVTFEGPKTPDSGEINRAIITTCLVPSEFTSGTKPGMFECARIRGKTLKRHIAEVDAFSPSNWVLRWFRVENPAIDPRERAQGVFLGAVSKTHGHDRFVLITEKGTHQAIMLDYPRNERGEAARKLFHEAIRSLRVSDDLGPGRAWVDQQIQSIRMDEMAKLGADVSSLSRLAEIQTILVAKATVDPKTYEAFYHLGGTTLMLARLAKKLNKDDWGLTSRPVIQTIQAAHLYAQDIAPADPRTARLSDLWLEAKKQLY